ncbi:unnamed protein product [Oreochromis niloticus]|nr:unnamed protein product [Mustela putorius furo]
MGTRTHRHSRARAYTQRQSLEHKVGLLLNGFILKFYISQAQQQASSSLMVYLKNLTAADFLLCLCLPLRITHYVSSSGIVYILYCSFGAASLYLNMYTSILFMAYIAVNRYLKIVHPSGTHVLQTVRSAHIVSMVTWVFLLALTITYNIMFFITHKPLTSDPGYCGDLFSTSFSVLHKTFQISCIIIFLLVFISLVFFYYITSRRVLQAQQKQLASSGSEKLVKSRRNMLVLVSIFCVCFVPYHLVRLPYAFLWNSCSVGSVLYYLKEAAIMVSVFNIWGRATVAQELGVRLVIGRLPVRAPAQTVLVVVSLGKTLHPLPTGGGQRARWRQCPAASPLSVRPRVAVATTFRNMVDPKNMTSPLNETCDLVGTSVNPFFMLGYSLLFVVGLPLNGFIMKFYFCGARQQASSSLMVYMKNMTAADFLLCLFLPLRIAHYGSTSVIFWQLYCSFGFSALYLNMYASIIFMCYVAANRYLKIVRPSGTHVLQSVRTANIVSIATWICLLTPSVTYGIMFFITQKPLTSTPSHCGLLFSASVSLMFKIMHTFSAIIFLLVSISLVFFYYSTSRRVLQAQQKQLASSGSEKLVKSRRNMLVLVSIFCVCFVPYHLVRLPATFLWNSCSVGPVLYYLKEVAIMVSVSNVCLDPVVYFFLCKTFRAQVKKMSRPTFNKQTQRVRALSGKWASLNQEQQVKPVSCKENFSLSERERSMPLPSGCSSKAGLTINEGKTYSLSSAH